MLVPALLRDTRMRARLVRRVGWTLVVLLVALLLGLWPVVWTSIGTDRATRCLAAWRAPREARPVSCAADVEWFVAPSRIPWTRTAASYRAEELTAREAIESYMDATIGHPDHVAAGRAGEAVERADVAMRAGSLRVELQELGPALAAPDLGYYAYLVGDRDTLVRKAEQWTAARVRLRALEAAVEDGEDTRAAAIADHYAGLDPHDDDLRTETAAALCLFGDAKKGLGLLEYLQSERAGIHHESFARDFGDVRFLILACAHKAGVAPGEAPKEPEAGQLDLPEARAVLRLRAIRFDDSAVAGRRGDDSAVGGRDSGGVGAVVRQRDAAEGAIGLLVEAERVPYRALVVGAVLASGFSLTPEEVAAIARPKPKEDPLAPALTTPFDWLEERPGVVPLPGHVALARAAERAAALSQAAEGGGLRDEIGELARALRLEAARAAVAELDEAGATPFVERASESFGGDAARRLGRATAFYAMGDRTRALDEIRSPCSGATTADQKRALVLEAELEASLGHRDAAGELAAKADAIAATDDGDVDVHARWTRLAFAKAPLRAPLAVDASDLSRALAWPAVSLFGAHVPWIAPAVEAQGDLDRALAMWSAADSASAAEQLPIRYALLKTRGDAPRARAAFLDVGARLLPAGGGDVEMWLDALFSIDARQLPMRTAAWARAEAARMRGDAAAAKRWDARREHLARVFASAPEIAVVLGI